LPLLNRFSSDDMLGKRGEAGLQVWAEDEGAAIGERRGTWARRWRNGRGSGQGDGGGWGREYLQAGGREVWGEKWTTG
jgi:hypothetical protein